MEDETVKKCPVCEGSGQVSYFGGESRFVVTWEDCPQCCGSGIEVVEQEERKSEE
jgi:DnaJ-class molecular chaperone